MSDEKTIIASEIQLTQYDQPGRQRACLVRYNGSDIGKRYILDETDMTMGRDADTCKLHISDATISRQHIRFVQEGIVVRAVDLGTTNGTFINDKKIGAPTVLKDGDMVRLGTVLLKFFSHGNIENVFHDKIYQKATLDQTTNVFNKQYLMDSLESEFKIAKNYQRPLSIIVYDLDFFKKVNDTFGHNAGDIILKETASIVKSAIRKNDILGRFGGEEFIIILPDTIKKTAYEFAERIRQKLEQHNFKLSGVTTRQTISMGVAEIDAQMKKSVDLIEIADQKLYESKRNGRNRVTV